MLNPELPYKCERIVPSVFNENRNRMLDSTIKSNSEREEFLKFLGDAWDLQPDYVSKAGPTYCNFPDSVKKECSPVEILQCFSNEVCLFLNGNNPHSSTKIVDGIKVGLFQPCGKTFFNN
jgi:hypothetical protein